MAARLTADVLIATVTEIEGKAALQAFEQITGQSAQPHSIGDLVCFDLGLIEGGRGVLVQSEMGSGGLGASQLTVSKAIEALSPVAVIMVGIAFGIDDRKQELGEILVTQQLRPYELQRVGTTDGQVKLRLRGDKPHASPWLLNHFRSFKLMWDGAAVSFGVVLTGEKLVDHIDFRQQLQDLEPEAIGGEMEGNGLYVACQDKKVDWILIKAICDWADGNKAQDKKQRQQTAAQNAAKFVVQALAFAPIDWQARRKTSDNGSMSSESPSPSKISDSGLAPALAMAKRSLAILEKQAAGYTSLTIPPHLQLQLEEKRQAVTELEQRMGGE
ncbi:MAG: hypothetical protein F6J87_22395 [Spirulina sp. SIO3F2]|nr:hypothetical protein [Spirulina sp. SIO3F2]